MLINQCPIEVFADKLRRRSTQDQADAQRDCPALSERKLIDINNLAAEKLAKEMNLWLPFADVSSLGMPAASGMENEMYLSEDGNTAYKVNNLMLSHSVSNLLDRIILHNAYFPQTRYELYGFTGFGRGSIYPILAQPYIKQVTFASPEDIRQYMHNLGFEPCGEAAFSDGMIIIKDLRPRNVLRNEAGDIWVIDVDFKVL